MSRHGPTGYPGDWHIIEQILDGSNRSECESWAWHLERAALESPIAQQHHEKIFWQADEIARTLESVTPPANILVLAAGGGRDLLSASVSLRRYQPNLFVNDWDGNALILVQSRLRYILDKSSVYQESAIATARRLRQKEKFDLVLAGGLFDYLSDRKSALLIRLITGDLLKRGGRFLLTNIATGNPHRPWMEYALNWRLIERSEEDLRKLCGIAGFGVDGLDIVRDKTGLTLLSELSCER